MNENKSKCLLSLASLLILLSGCEKKVEREFPEYTEFESVGWTHEDCEKEFGKDAEEVCPQFKD